MKKMIYAALLSAAMTLSLASPKAEAFLFSGQRFKSTGAFTEPKKREALKELLEKYPACGRAGGCGPSSDPVIKKLIGGIALPQ
jgi:hypothetical protein